jgi:hypothetical protein
VVEGDCLKVGYVSFVVRLFEQKIRSRVLRVVVSRVECEMGAMQRCEEGEEER